MRLLQTPLAYFHFWLAHPQMSIPGRADAVIAAAALRSYHMTLIYFLTAPSSQLRTRERLRDFCGAQMSAVMTGFLCAEGRMEVASAPLWAPVY